MFNKQEHIDGLTQRYPALRNSAGAVCAAYEVMEKCFAEGYKLLVCGNGGSCADSEHIVGELLKGFKLKRPCPEEFSQKLVQVGGEMGKELSQKLQGALPTIALTCHQALNTAFANDVAEGGKLAFAQQVYGYGKQGDALLAISTSGNSQNVLYAAVAARALGMKVIALTGEGGGKLSEMSDVCVKVPASDPYLVQEYHLPVYHCLCLMLEERFFG